MQQLKLPQSPFVTPNFMVAGEWLVFLNEFIRLLNLLISSGTIDAAQEAIDLASTTRVTMDFIHAQDDASQAGVVHLSVNDYEDISQVGLVMQNEEPKVDTPYAQLSAIEQQLYDQQIWNLTV